MPNPFDVRFEGDDPRDLRFHPADPASAVILTASQVEEFNHRGFITPVRLFNDDEILEIRAYLDELINTVLSAEDRRNGYSIVAYHLVCRGLYDLMCTPAIVERVADLVGPDVVGWASQVFCKVPGDAMEVPLHQDAIYYPFTPSRTVSVWIALDDVDADNGAMEFVPGSHTLGGIAHCDVVLDGTRVLDRSVLDIDDTTETFVNELPAGSASLHSDLLLHRSPPNRSNRRRAGIALRYGPASMRTIPGFEPWSTTAVECRGPLPEWWTACRPPDGEHPERMADFVGVFDGN
jgi:hypothetical protein